MLPHQYQQETNESGDSDSKQHLQGLLNNAKFFSRPSGESSTNNAVDYLPSGYFPQQHQQNQLQPFVFLNNTHNPRTDCAQRMLKLNYNNIFSLLNRMTPTQAAQLVATSIYKEKCKLPPAEPLHLHKSLLADFVALKDRQFDYEKDHRTFIEELKKGEKEIRSQPDDDILHNHGVPYGSDFPQYQLLDGFNFAEPAASRNLNQPKLVTDAEYDLIREDFNGNGRDVEVKPKANLKPETDFFSSFPPLPADPDLLSAQWQLLCERPIPKKAYSSVESIAENPKPIVKSLDLDVSFTQLEKPSKVLMNGLKLQHCVFCKNNGEDEKVFTSHTLKDFKGRTLCPKLRLYKCPKCGKDGDEGERNAELFDVHQMILGTSKLEFI